MIESLWIIAPVFLFCSCLAFVCIYLPAFWPNRASKLAQNQMLMPMLLLLYSGSVAWFRIVTSLMPPPPPHPDHVFTPAFEALFTVEHVARIVVDLCVGAVMAWRATQVCQIQHETRPDD